MVIIYEISLIIFEYKSKQDPVNKILIYAMFLSIFSCNNTKNSKAHYYGENISTENISDYKEVKQLVKKQGSVDTKIEGTIISTCLNKGCWMNVRVNQDTILVRFKDYGFFVPKEGQENKQVIMRGAVKTDTISVEMLIHYAEDAKLSIEEINKITEPDYSISFLADGVIIK